MPTVAELNIVLEAQDRASAQLRAVGQAVHRLEQQVQGVQRQSRGGLLGGLQIGAGIAAAQQAFSALGGVFGFVRDSVITLNSELERNVTVFRQLTGSAEAAADVVAALRQEAARSPFSDRELMAAGVALIGVTAERSTESLLRLVGVAERLTTLNQEQGLEGAAFAVGEAVSGDFQSLIERFRISREEIARFRAEGLSNLEVVEAVLNRLGVGAESVERLGRTFEGRTATIRSFGDELRGLVGRGLFDRLNELLGGLVRLIEDFGDRLRVVATGIGTFLGAVAERLSQALVGPLRAFFDLFAPGLFDELLVSFSRVPAAIEETGDAARQAAQPVQSLERRLGGLGVAAARLSLDADRVRHSYDEQIQPLERQLRLLQQSADLQRVQNALATNRSTVEGIRLEREVAALRRAAGGRTDPNAPGLTLRQRLIALALQEKELRQEELGLEGQRRPLMQQLEQEIARLQEEQRKALEPLERSLALRRDEIAALQLVRQEEALLAEDVAATARERVKGWTTQNPGALDEVKKRGEELATAWLKGWQDELDKNGGDIWKTLGQKLEVWYKEFGKPLADRVGTDLGTALGTAAGTSFWESLQKILSEGLGGAPAVPGGVHPDIANTPGLGDVLVRAGGGLPVVTVPVSPPGRPGAGTQITINVGDLATGPGFQQRLQTAFAQFWQQFIQSEAATEPGASPALQGAGRAP